MSLLSAPHCCESYSRMDFLKVLSFQERGKKETPWVNASKEPENYSEKSPFLGPFHVLLLVPNARVHSKQTPDTVSAVQSSSSTAGTARLPQEGTSSSEHPTRAALCLSKSTLPCLHGQLLL